MTLTTFAALVSATQPRPKPEPVLREVVTEHFKRTFSADALTRVLKERLAHHQQRQRLADELDRLDRELHVLSALPDARVLALRTRIGEMKKQMGPTGPSP